MTSQQVGLLLIQLFVSVGILAFVGLALLRSTESTLKYRMFGVRDKFLYLAATGVLPQSSMVFKVFYRAMNDFITETESLTIFSLIRASMAVRTQLEKENRSNLMESLRRADPQVQAVVDEFIRSVMDALRYNSPLLTMILGFAHHCASLFSALRKLRPVRLRVYETYRYYETIHGTMKAA